MPATVKLISSAVRVGEEVAQPRDLGPLTWVMAELRHTLNETSAGVQHFVDENELARRSDLAEVDATPLRMLRQQVHQAAGALEMVNLPAAGRTMQALEAVLQRLIQKPAMATLNAGQSVTSGTWAVLDYLDRQMNERPVHELALFPVYQDWQQLAGVNWVHPAELWQYPLDAVAVPPQGRSWPMGTQVRSHMERLVLLVVKSQNPQAADQLAKLCGGLARCVHDAHQVPTGQFWLAAAAYAEALAHGLLPDNIYTKRAASRLLLQYAALAQGTPHGLEAQTRELLLLVARAVPLDSEACPHLNAVRSAHGFVGQEVPDWDAKVLGLHDPMRLMELRESVRSAQQAWALLTKLPAKQELAGAAASLRALCVALHALIGEMGGLSACWLQLTELLETLGMPGPDVALEVSNGLLFLEAQALDFDLLDPELPQRLTQLADRMNAVLSGQPAAEPQEWMSRLYRQMSQRRTLDTVVTQLRSELMELEQALELFLVQPDSACLTGWPRRLDSLRGVLVMLGLSAAEQALAHIRGNLQAWLDIEQVPFDERHSVTEQILAPNLSVLSWLLDTLARQPRLAQEGFYFDAGRRLLLSRLQAEVAEGAGQEVLANPEAADPRGLDDPVDASGSVFLVDELKQDEETNEDAELLSVFLAEARDVLLSAQGAIDALRQKSDSLADLTALRRAFHTVKGSARMVGMDAIGESAWAMEQLLNTWLADQKTAQSELLDLCIEVVELLAKWVGELESGSPVQDCSEAIRASADALRLDGIFRPVSAAKSATSGGTEPEPEPQSQAEFKTVGSLQIDAELFAVFLDEAEDWSLQLSEGLAQLGQDPLGGCHPSLERLAHQLAGASATVGHVALSQLSRALEHALERAEKARMQGRSLSQSDTETLIQAGDVARQLLHQFAAGFLREPQAELLQALGTLAISEPATIAEAPSISAAAAEAVLVPAQSQSQSSAQLDHLDADLFPVFEDEALDLFQRLGAMLRQWNAQPDDDQARAEVLRCLHTLKGSARLAGAMRLGEMFHQMESQALSLPEPLLDPMMTVALMHALDDIELRFSALRSAFSSAAVNKQTEPVDGVRLETAEGSAISDAPIPLQDRMPPTLTSAWMAPGVSTVRVRTDLLDSLMVRTGDVMTTRNLLEADMRSLQQSFKDMGGNLDRLRLQLRELEIQTESRVQALQIPQQGAESAFDPLEFDRYTRLQELTRLLAESVNDVATVQRSLKRAVEGAEGSLAAQARQTRELQHDLLRTRLMAFDQMAERLHRLVRQTAESQGKLVELQVEGGEVEADRGVLDRVLPVLEHLLRNAVVHGIELPSQRLAVGKHETGRAVLTLRQNGNDLMLTVEDDGAGLDFQRIRDKAVIPGAEKPDGTFGQSDALLAIFKPGLSTADEVTEVAGRGIGLDVARSEVLGLGGHIEAYIAPMGGLGFRLVVPLTTAVTQVVMVRVGDVSFGVPAPWVQVVRRASSAELTAAYVSGQWREAGVLMPFHWSGALLALSPQSLEAQSRHARSWPVLVFQSAGQQVAWHVDEVLGHQEVVVKPLGPQLMHLPGLTGATVLASGTVTLIYNPVAISTLHGEASRVWVRAQREALTRPVAAKTPAQVPLVLVVDDSITVRRVTQRLLKREGYRVAQAADGLQALERLREETPVVVLCDIEMPRMDGFELLRQLRADPRWASLPVVMITSRTADKHQEHARRLGVDHYLGKPYAEDDLLALVSAYARLTTE